MYGLYVQTHGEGSSLMSPDLAIRGVWRICLFPSQGFVLNDDPDLRFCVCCNLDRPLLASPEPESETAFRTSLSHTFTYVVHVFAIARGDRWVLRWFLDISQTKVSLSYKSVLFSALNSPSIPQSLPCSFFHADSMFFMIQGRLHIGNWGNRLGQSCGNTRYEPYEQLRWSEKRVAKR